MPAALSSRDDGRQAVRGRRPRPARPRWCAPRAAPGTMQAACGRWRSAIASISVGGRHFQVQRQRRSRPSAARCRASVMWRRSSRRCAVMPSAPAAPRRARPRDRVGMTAAARVADRGDVVDVHAEAQRAFHASSSSLRCRTAEAPYRLWRGADTFSQRPRARSTELMTGVARRAAMILVRCLTSLTSMSISISKKSVLRLVIFRLVMLPAVLADHGRERAEAAGLVGDDDADAADMRRSRRRRCPSRHRSSAPACRRSFPAFRSRSCGS